MNRGDPSLTDRELQVLASLISGKTDREIGKELNIAESTVKSHLSLMFAEARRIEPDRSRHGRFGDVPDVACFRELEGRAASPRSCPSRLSDTALTRQDRSSYGPRCTIAGCTKT